MARLRNVIVVSASGRPYALELRWIREIITLAHLTPVPGSPDAIVGLVNHRGSILTILSIPALLGESAASDDYGESGVLIEVDGVHSALQIHSVDEVASLRAAGDDDSHLMDSRGREARLLRPTQLMDAAAAATLAVSRRIGAERPR